jgi:Immunoglobulin domain
MNYGDTVSVNCIVTGGDLPITISWKWNNQSIADVYFANDILIEKRGKRISMLSIEAVTAHHIGTYTCIAENGAGVTEQQSELNVNGIVLVLRY